MLIGSDLLVTERTSVGTTFNSDGFHFFFDMDQTRVTLSKKPGAHSSHPGVCVVRALTFEARKQKAVASVSDRSRSCSTSPLSSVSAR